MRGRFTKSDDETPMELVGLMKHVPHGREGRETARDETLGPMKERAAPTAKL